MDDPWLDKKCDSKIDTSNRSFGSDFTDFKNAEPQNTNLSDGSVLNDAYSQKLEEKLERLQKKKKTIRNDSGKDMLFTFKCQRESHMTHLMEATTTPSISSNVTTIENPTFFENLYHTSSVYRHMNPQQALESTDKLPIVQYDHLNTPESTGEVEPTSNVTNH